MTPYYEADGIFIYHGDCAEIAPQLGMFDLLCTDPPYGIGEARKNHGEIRKAPGGGKFRVKPSDRDDWDDAPPGQPLIDGLRSKARWQCLFGGNYFAMPPSPCWLVWDKENGETDFADAELAWTNYTGAVRLRRHRWNGMLRLGNEQRYHPTQKPLAVMTWAISLCPERPTSVFDPFMGSGTTLRACKDLGIPRAVGIEREEKYCEIAVRRLAQRTLFDAGT
ncbi:MAG TPA: DNA methyltransferase [Xanthobacteraceae bacterium]|nr:DNA methyltransferase [Xanthobacteraceae bacterium]